MRDRGWTLVESMVVVAVLAVLLATAVPSMRAAMDGQRLQGAVATLRDDLQRLRNDALRDGERRHFSAMPGRGGSCYVLYRGTPGDCTCASDGTSRCQAGSSALKTAGFAADSPVQIASATSTTFSIEPLRGFVTPTATLVLSLPDGQALAAKVAITGRLRQCIPGSPGC